MLPLRWSPQTSRRETPALAAYLRRLSSLADVTVVDGSAPAELERHARHWSGSARLLRPQPWPGRNGKVAGVVTGVRAARHEHVVVADDDVRYEPEPLAQVVDALRAGADLVAPQNLFSPTPWHARWDTGRILLGRALGVDFPGTFGVRRSAFLAVGGYDGDVLFENLELLRTFSARGRRVAHLPGTYVRRSPPTTGQFLSQRVRQAYDELARPGRLAAQLALLPILGWAARRSPRTLLAVAAATVLAAEGGRRRAGGAAVYPSTAALWALPWIVERAVCVWLAVLERARGGVRYRGERLPRAATPVRRLRAAAPPPLSPLDG